MRKELHCKQILSFSNGVVEALILKIKSLDMLLVAMYRPPNTDNDSWIEALEKVNSEIGLAQANGSYSTIIVTGDFNMGKVNWNKGNIEIIPGMSKQEIEFVNFVTNNFLENKVMKPTRNSNILDLVLTNDQSGQWC